MLKQPERESRNVKALFYEMEGRQIQKNEQGTGRCSLRPLAVANAFFNGRYAEQNGRSYLVDC